MRRHEQYRCRRREDPSQVGSVDPDSKGDKEEHAHGLLSDDDFGDAPRQAARLEPQAHRFIRGNAHDVVRDLGINGIELDALEHHLKFEQSEAAGRSLMQVLRDATETAEEHVRRRTIPPLLQRLDCVDQHKVKEQDMRGPTDTEGVPVLFSFLPALQAVQQLLMKPCLLGCWEWDSTPKYTSSGERLYSTFNSGNWCRDIERAPPSSDGAAAPVLLSLIWGSDGTPTPGGFEKEAHPVYLSCGNLSHAARASDQGWELAGLVPCTPSPKPGVSLPPGRRRRLLLAHCLATVFDSIEDAIWRLPCSDGHVRQFEIRLAVGIVDRKEAEDVMFAYQHQCFECLHSRESACVVAELPWERTHRATDGRSLRKRLDEAAFTGVYGSNAEWQDMIQHAAPILRPCPHPPVDGYEVAHVILSEQALNGDGVRCLAARPLAYPHVIEEQQV